LILALVWYELGNDLTLTLKPGSVMEGMRLTKRTFLRIIL